MKKTVMGNSSCKQLCNTRGSNTVVKTGDEHPSCLRFQKVNNHSGPQYTAQTEIMGSLPPDKSGADV